ncbi:MULTISPECIES: hypothetical protein [Chryseobacterium]|jgi:hypothetical protein|uniref:Signal transducing protein n=1 Tax=Chryseobacterium geocarposphaerae TaxID=1416776 RepID=A0ABU1LBV7_9FLAO|nr:MULTISPECIES: hypothetical protein [Chryseobacterium]MDR6404075.1 hypothetical protein [Chryseobacterium geocarposphaerae]MDR6698406.1 hypothetical protein [Chryseobacterium ginsenosidimutans]
MKELVKFKFYESILQANRDREILAESGINSFTANEYLIQSNWLYSQAVGGIQLWVFEENIEKAHYFTKL